MTKDSKQGALRIDPVIAPLVKWLKTTFSESLAEKISLLFIIYSKLLNHFIFAHLLLIKDYEQSALRMELIITSLIEWFKTASLR